MAGGTSNGTSAGERLKQLAAFVAEQLWAGQTPHQVVRELEDRGVDSSAAAALVDAIEERLRRGGAL